MKGLTLNNVDTPCRLCIERNAECHVTCDRYKKWRNEFDEVKRKYAKSFRDNPKINKGDFLGDDGLISKRKFRGMKIQKKK